MSIVELSVLLLSIGLTVVAIKIGVSFDINRWSEARHRRREEKLQVLCPHATIEQTKDGDFVLACLMTSPHGTSMWICSRCGTRTHDGSRMQRIMDEYASNPKTLVEREKQFLRLAEKHFGT